MKRTVKYGTNTALSIIMTIGVIVFAMLISYNNHKRFDMTHNKSFTLSDQTKKVLHNLDKEVEVLVFHTKGAGFLNEARNLLDQYEYESKKFKVIPLDFNTHPAEAKEYNLTQRNCLVIKSGDRREVLARTEEDLVTNAVVKVIQDEKRVVYFTTGHGERNIKSPDADDFGKVHDALLRESYEVREINLAREDKVPDDCQTLVIAGPKTDFFEEEINRLKDYINRGGAVFFMFAPRYKNTHLAAYLKTKGLIVGDDFVIDRVSKAIGGDFYIPVATMGQYGDHAILRDFHLMTFFPYSRSIRPIEGFDEIHWTSLVLTSPAPASWAETDPITKDSKLNYDPGKDLPGPITLGAAATMEVDAENPEKPEGNSEKPSEDEKKPTRKKEVRLVVFGNTDFASNHFFQQQGNSNLFLNCMSWLSEQEAMISIRPKASKYSPLFLTAQDQNKIWLFSFILLPALIIMAGIASMVYRKN